MAERMRAMIGKAPAALAHRNLLLTQALDAVHSGDLDSAQQLLSQAEDDTPTLSQVFGLYRAELETQAQQLKDSQARTELALDWTTNLFRTLPVAAILVDHHGLIVDANQHALDELRLRDALRVRPVPLRRLMAGTDGELRLAGMLNRVACGETAGLDDMALCTLDGTPRWADLRVTQVPARTGAASGAPLTLCVFNDRTARVEAQRAREAAAAAEQQRAKAESASQAKTELLSRVSHELRTPLNAVIGFSHLLLMDPQRLDADSQRKVGHIGEAGRHLLALVDEVLQINRTEAGLLPLACEPVDLCAVAEEVLALQEAMARPLDLTLDCRVQPPDAGPVLATGDGRRVREVLQNLVSNAIKYNRPGGWVRLTIAQDDDAVRIDVADSGIGLTTEQQAHLFEPFNRLGAERLAVVGHGLGLSIARTLVQAMNGQLTIDASSSHGCRFTVSLPPWRG